MANAAEKLPETPEILNEFRKYEHFCRVMLDAFVLVDRSGKIVKCNQMFSQLVGKTMRQIMKSGTFDELLELFIKDQRIQITDLLQYVAHTRIDEVRGRNQDASELTLIIGVYPFVAEGNSPGHIGTFVLIRDVTAEHSLQDKYTSTHMKSITDPLTTLFTRGYFEDYLELQVRTMKAMLEGGESQSMNLIMADIDFFKKVNDVHGHQAGDFVLRTMGMIMKKSFRKTDILCRYGGEEFLVILPSTDMHGATLAAEKLRQAVEAETVIFDGTPIPITISAGIAEIIIETETYMETLARADAALYQSKKDGRNRVSIHDGAGIKRVNKG